MRNLVLSLVCAASVIGGVGVLEAADVQEGRGGPATDPTLCRDEAGGKKDCIGKHKEAYESGHIDRARHSSSAAKTASGSPSESDIACVVI
jgi:hypothetical protein